MNDIISNVKVSSWLKNQLLKNVSDIFTLSQNKDNKDDLVDALSSSLLICYLLSCRFAIDLETINEEVLNKVKLGIQNHHICEREFCDLSLILKHIRGETNESSIVKRRKRQR